MSNTPNSNTNKPVQPVRQPLPYPQPAYPAPYNPYNPYGYSQPANPNYRPVMPDKRTIVAIRNREVNRLVPERSGRMWGSIMFKPDIAFEGQNEDEKVYILLRRHWLANLGWVLRNIFYTLVPPAFFIVIASYNINVSFVSMKVFFLILLAYYSIIFTNVIRLFIDWYFDPFMVTNERIVNFEFVPFSNYHVAELELENIQDIRESSEGILGQVFNYGTIEVLSANSTVRISFQKIPDSTKVRDIIADLSKIAKEYRYGDI